MPFCRRCGAEIEYENVGVCSKCGAEVLVTDAAIKEAQVLKPSTHGQSEGLFSREIALTIRIVFIITGIVGGYELANAGIIPELFSQYKIVALILYIILGATIGYILSKPISRRLLISLVGLLTGLVLAWLVSMPFGYVQIPFLRFSVSIFASIVLGYLGVRIALRWYY